jgi:hypothetical protein
VLDALAVVGVYDLSGGERPNRRKGRWRSSPLISRHALAEKGVANMRAGPISHWKTAAGTLLVIWRKRDSAAIIAASCALRSVMSTIAPRRPAMLPSAAGQVALW